MQHRLKKRMPDFVIIGQITRPHGVKGAVRVKPLTDDPKRFTLLKRVFVTFGGTKRQTLTIQGVQFLNRFVVLRCAEIAGLDQAETYRNAYLQIPREECLPLPAGSFYYFELIGLMAKSMGGEVIGELVDVLPYPANDVYVVRSGDREILIPAVPDIVKKVDTKAGEIIINVIDGLMD
jgi:16S rRNA processing protein RimM